MYKKSIFAGFSLLLLAFVQSGFAQTTQKDAVFRKVKLLVNENGKFRQKAVTVAFEDDRMTIEGQKGVFKVFTYGSIKNAEYSYTKNPRWKTGLGLSAAAVVLPPLWLISIPIGFTKHRRHWLTIRTSEDFAVLKLSKKNRKLLIPTFETRSGISVKALGEDK